MQSLLSLQTVFYWICPSTLVSAFKAKIVAGQLRFSAFMALNGFYSDSCLFPDGIQKAGITSLIFITVNKLKFSILVRLLLLLCPLAAVFALCKLSSYFGEYWREASALCQNMSC